MTKAIKNQGKGIDGAGIAFEYKNFTDGSSQAKCAKCGAWEDIAADAPVRKKSNPFQNYTCKPCFENPRRVEIARGQAMNLAASFVAPLYKIQRDTASRKEIENPKVSQFVAPHVPLVTAEMLSSLHAYFFAQLTGQEELKDTHDAQEGQKVEEEKPIASATV